MRVQIATGVVLASLAACGSAGADVFVPGVALSNPGLSGVTQYDGWIGLTNANYPGFGGFPGSAPWPGGVGSNRTTANAFNAAEGGDASLIKVSSGTGGGPYLAGGSIYFGGFSSAINNNGGTLAVTDSTPVAGLSNVVFQVQIGEAWTVDFFDDVLPVLSYNGGTQRLQPVWWAITDQFDNGTVTMPTGEETVYINTYMLQWDLSSLAGTITDFRVEFTGVQHAQVYGLRLDQSSVYAAIPTPGAAALMGFGGLFAVRRRR